MFPLKILFTNVFANDKHFIMKSVLKVSLVEAQEEISQKTLRAALRDVPWQLQYFTVV